MEVPVMAPQVALASATISLRTSAGREFIDITDQVQHCVVNAGVEQGLAIVASRHTTAAVIVNEHEPELLKDLERLLDGIAPEASAYLHNAVPCLPGERPNGHSHCQALLLTSSATVPVVEGRLALGRYQRIFFVELDCSRLRHVAVIVLGS